MKPGWQHPDQRGANERSFYFILKAMGGRWGTLNRGAPSSKSPLSNAALTAEGRAGCRGRDIAEEAAAVVWVIWVQSLN